MAAASLSSAQSVSSRLERSGPRPQASPDTLLGRMGPHTSDSGTGQTPAGPVLPHHRGEIEHPEECSD